MEEAMFVPGNVAMNLGQLMQARSLASVLAGVVAGVMGIEGILVGSLFFFLAMLASSAIVVISVPKLEEYFQDPSSVYTSGIASGLMGYVLCWTISFNLCHIF